MYKPQFTISSKTVNLIAKIETIREKVKTSKILPEQEIALRFRAAIEAIHSSTTIEGNPLNKKQVVNALAGKMNSWEKAVIEVQNYKKALDWVAKRLKKKENLNLQDVLKLHFFVSDQLLPVHKVGQIRSGPVYIVDIINKKELVRYTGPGAKIVTSLLNDLLLWVKTVKSKLHPILTAAILHYEFVSIHPFSDGNGRVTRLLVKLFLDLMSYDFRGALVLDKYYLENRLVYYDNLNQAKRYKEQTRTDLTNWLDFFVNGFYEIAKDLEKEISVVSISDERDIVRLSNDEIKILDFAKQFGQININDALEVLQTSARTTQRRFRGLIDKKLLIKHGMGKKIFYKLKKPF